MTSAPKLIQILVDGEWVTIGKMIYQNNRTVQFEFDPDKTELVLHWPGFQIVTNKEKTDG